MRAALSQALVVEAVLNGVADYADFDAVAAAVETVLERNDHGLVDDEAAVAEVFEVGGD